MKLLGKDGSELIVVDSIERAGCDLVLRGKVMGAMPIVAILQPSELRSAIRMMPVRLWPFALSMIFRR